MAGEIFQLANESPEALGRLTRGVQDAVARSFVEDKNRDRRVVMTQDEVKRRGRICVEVVRSLRGDLGWSVARIVDALPQALRAKLDGAEWDPSKLRHVWAPDA